MQIEDYSVSKEIFYLKYNEKYDLYQTEPVPENLSFYYQSNNYISHTDSKKSFFEKIYQVAKKYMLQQKISLIEKYIPQKGKILDIGAGTGDFLRVAKEKKWQIAGVEPEAKARSRAEEKGIFLEENQNHINEKYDAITMWHVLEHIPDTEKQIQFLDNHLSENGIVVIAVPNFKSKDAKIYGKYWAAYDVPRHLWHFSKTSIHLLFKEKGFQLIKIKPMWLDAFYVSLLSEKYKTGKINFIKGIFNGFLSNWSALRTGEYSSLIYILKKEK
ncbi:MAG: class I SAM-dependent methyltransferase [Capnocytophaga sp.]|nr:class I SAM-dependent methyltransferase [Capnocytophaga sp.]